MIETSRVIFARYQPTVEQVLTADSDGYTYRVDENDDYLRDEEGRIIPDRTGNNRALPTSVIRWRRAKRLHLGNSRAAFHLMKQDGTLEETDPRSYFGSEHGITLDGPFDITEPLPRDDDDLPFTDDPDYPFTPWAMSF
jgi:hypothetical protein